MLDVLFLQKIVFSIFAGALLGLERQYTKKQEFAGLRTFALVSLLGTICVVVSQELIKDPAIILVGFLLACVFGIGFYLASFMKKRVRGFTTSMAIILSYLLGVMVGYGLFFETVFLSIIVAIILFSKERMHHLVEHLNEREVGELLEFLVVLGIIYPIMPKEIMFYGITIPVFTIWLLVVLMSLINFVAFLLARKMSAEHEIRVISFLGGLVSSTATLISVLDIYKKNRSSLPIMSGGFLLLNAASLVRNLFLVVLVVPAAGAIAAIPALICAGIMVFFGLRMMKTKTRVEKLRIKSPFNVKRGIKLAVAIAFLFIILDFLSFSDTRYFLAFAFLGGIAETSATIISLVTMHTEAVITAKVLAVAMITSQMGGFLQNIIACRAYGGEKVLEKAMVPFAFSIAAAFITLAVMIFI